LLYFKTHFSGSLTLPNSRMSMARSSDRTIISYHSQSARIADFPHLESNLRTAVRTRTGAPVGYLATLSYRHLPGRSGIASDRRRLSSRCSTLSFACHTVSATLAISHLCVIVSVGRELCTCWQGEGAQHVLFGGAGALRTREDCVVAGWVGPAGLDGQVATSQQPSSAE